MIATDLYKKIINENPTKSGAQAALSSFANRVNKNLFKNKTAAEFEGLTRDTAKSMIEEVRMKIEKTEPLIITLAIQLPEQELLDLGTKVRKLFGRDFLFDLAVNTSLLAGAQLVYKGRQLDLSLKNKLENSKPLILEICKKYLRE